MKKISKEKKRNFVIGTWGCIGSALAIFGLIVLASAEDGLKYFGNTFSETVLLFGVGITMLFIGIGMVSEYTTCKEKYSK